MSDYDASIDLSAKGHRLHCGGLLVFWVCIVGEIRADLAVSVTEFGHDGVRSGGCGHYDNDEEGVEVVRGDDLIIIKDCCFCDAVDVVGQVNVDDLLL